MRRIEALAWGTGLVGTASFLVGTNAEHETIRALGGMGTAGVFIGVILWGTAYLTSLNTPEHPAGDRW